MGIMDKSILVITKHEINLVSLIEKQFFYDKFHHEPYVSIDICCERASLDI